LFKQPDASSVIRFTRWQIGLKAWANDATAIVFGMGPSFAGAATDGYYVRLLVGQGILGFVLFGWLIRRARLAQVGFPGGGRYLATLLITACFIDIFVSYRPMLLLWLGLGAALGSRQNANLGASEGTGHSTTAAAPAQRGTRHPVMA
jgi:hypothetical protein